MRWTSDSGRENAICSPTYAPPATVRSYCIVFTCVSPVATMEISEASVGISSFLGSEDCTPFAAQ